MIPGRLPLAERLVEHPYEFQFFQAVRLLALIASDRPGLGSTAHPVDEIVRFAARQSLQFAPSAIHSIDTQQDPLKMTVSFFGLTGIQGVLPLHYTEHIIKQAAIKDFAMADFLDLFNHRLISLFYRAWEKHSLPARDQLAFVRRQPGGVASYLLAIIGLGTARLDDRNSFPDEALLRYAGQFAQWPRSAVNLERILTDYFDVPVSIQQFVGSWHPIAPEDRCNLNGEGLNDQLGAGAVAGDAVWDPQAGIRIRIGVLSLSRFLSFLPDGDAALPLREIVQFFVGPACGIEWQPVLAGAEVPWCRLGDESAVGPRLGWTAWLKTGEAYQEADDAVFSLGPSVREYGS